MNIQIKNYNHYIKKLRKRLKNDTVSIISNNCIGGIIYHDLGLRFYSPTISTLIYGEEFIEFVKYLKDYINCELKYEDSKDYPIGTLTIKDKKTIHIHFLHDTSFAEAKANWDRRKSRINFDNIFLIYEHFNKSSDEIIQNFDDLKYKKVVFTHKKYPNIDSAIYIRACRKEKSFGTITKFKNKISGKRNLYQYDIVKHIND